MQKQAVTKTVDRLVHISPYRLKTSPFSSHGRILRYLSTWTRTARILEAGTVHGYFGKALREAGFTHLVGLERDPLCVKAARAVYTEVVECDLEELEVDSLGRFDLILCADVLEHLEDPPKALNKLIQMLNPQGRLIVSVPNSGHWWMRLNILCGRFPLEERGLFDRGHLRFFTWATLRDLVHQAGLTIEQVWITPVPISIFCGNGIGGRMALWAEAVYCAIAYLWKRFFAYQFVLSTARRIK